MSFSLNEKTLELNISAEILRICRRYDPKAFMFGTTLRQEGSPGYGYDSRALGRIPQFWRTAVFQFKRALQVRNTPLDYEYTFQINNNGKCDQHLLLYNMCGGKPLTALYVLPLYVTLNDVRNAAPNLLNNTLFADVADIPPQLIDRTPHTLLVYPRRLKGIIFSERKEIKLIHIEEAAKSIAEKKIGISIEELRKKLKMGKIEGWESASKRPRFTFQIFPSF
ncbi:MAG: hypothetical protein QXK93_08115 [Candidatus Bathyarchaeia archaeon]